MAGTGNDDKICGNCKQPINRDSEILSCCGCFTIFHESCTGRCLTDIDGIYTCCYKASSQVSIDDEEVEPFCDIAAPLSGDMKILQDNLMKFFSGETRRIGKCLSSISRQLLNFKTSIATNTTNIENLRTDYDELNKRVSALEGKLDPNNNQCSTLNNISTAAQDNLNQLTSEIKDRLHRSQNLIFYNVPIDQEMSDVDKIKTYISKIPKINADNINVRRFTKPTKRSKIPPIVVRFATSSDVFKVTSNKKLLPEVIKVVRDRTPAQRDRFKRLYDIVTKHNDDHPNQLKAVRYINDDPAIVDATDLPKGQGDKSHSENSS